MHWSATRATCFAAVLWLAFGRAATAAEDAAATPQPLTPEQTVTRYLEALKAGNFPACFDLISQSMAGGKSRDAWSKEQQWTMQMSDAKILDFHVYPGK